MQTWNISKIPEKKNKNKNFFLEGAERGWGNGRIDGDGLMVVVVTRRQHLPAEIDGDHQKTTEPCQRHWLSLKATKLNYLKI